MNAAVLVLAAAWLGLQTAAAQDLPQLPCGDADRACAQRAMARHPVSRIDGWSQARALPAVQRIGAAPAPLVEYLRLDNIVNGFAERPRAATPEAGFVADVQAAIAGLPPQVWRFFDTRLLGIYFVENLGGTGYTDVVMDAAGRPVAGYVVLDAIVLGRHSANAWASWKENTPFRPSAQFRLEARIEDDAGDNRVNAIQYILLHELGHVLSIGADIHPPWNQPASATADTARYPYFDLSWKFDRRSARYLSRFDPQFPQRARVVYYFGARLAASEMVPTYANLEKTNFPSLYAATRPGDDFAEAFASYVHVVLMKRPWEIRLFHHGSMVKAFKSCWELPRCAPKRRLLEQLLARPANRRRRWR